MRTMVLIVAAMVTSPALANPLDELAARLVATRAEVESLQTELAEEQAQHGHRLRSLAGQRMELEAAVQREELKVRRFDRSLEAVRTRRLESTVQAEELEPIARQTIKSLRQRVRAGLPFQIHERIAVLDNLERQLVTGTLAPAKVIGRLWAFYEDEVRLATESGMYRQAITIGDGKVLADVARIGMVMLYYRIGDRFGHAVQTDSGWQYRDVEAARSRDQIRELFLTFEKKIRTGFFELPNPRAIGDMP